MVFIALTAALVYFLAWILLVRQVAGMATGRDIFKPERSTTSWTVDCAGYQVPVWAVFVLWTILPTIWLGFELARIWERRWREKHDCCLDCGRKITSWRGKCPGCGMRIGPG